MMMLMFLFAKFPLFSPRSNLLRFYIFGIERRRLVPTKMLFVEGQVSTDVVDQQHAVTKKICLTETEILLSITGIPERRGPAQPHRSR